MAKSGKVRMEISRTWHGWFKMVDGKTNDERMENLFGNKDSSQVIIEDLESELTRIQSSADWYKRALQIQKDNCKLLSGALAVSITVNFVLLAYASAVNGWFL